MVTEDCVDILKVGAKSFDWYIDGERFSYKCCLVALSVQKLLEINVVGFRSSKLSESDVCWQSVALQQYLEASMNR